MSEGKASLGSRVIGGGAWIATGRMGVRVIGVVSTLILARLLSPEDFGLVAVAMALLATLEHSTDFGFNNALIRLHDATEPEYATAWSMNLSRGAVLALALFLAADPMARFLEDDRLAVLFTILAALPLIQSLENVHFIDFERRLHFRPLARVMIGTKMITFVVTLGVAIVTRSYWALIAGMFAGRISRLAITYWMVPYRPYVTFSGWSRLLGFSGWLAGASLIQGISQRLDALLLKKFVTADAVGLFHVARELTAAPFQEIVAPLRRALFPGFSEIADDPPAFRDAYFASVSGIFMIVAPLCGGLALVAGDAIPVLLGSQWLEMVPYARMLALLPLIAVMGQQAIPAIMASGHTRLWFVRNLISAPLRLGGFLGGAWLDGVAGAVTGLLLVSVVISTLNMGMGARVVGGTIGRHLLVCWRSLAALTVMAACVASLQYLMPVDGELPAQAIRLTAAIAIGGAAYVGIHYLLWSACGRPWGAEARVANIVTEWSGRVRSRAGRQSGPR